VGSQPAGPVVPLAGLALPVRRIPPEDLRQRGAQIAEMAEGAPEEGVNLWVARNPVLDATIHLLGTHHGLRLTQVQGWGAVIRYLRDGRFTHVYTETTGRSAEGELPATDTLIDYLKRKVSTEEERDKAEQAKDEKKRIRANALVGQLDLQTAKIDTLSLDDAYAALAMTCTPKPKRSELETTDSRSRAHEQNRLHGVPTANTAPVEMDAAAKEKADKELDAQNARDKKDVSTGNQRAIFSAQAKEMRAGLDLASAEERNRQWIDGTAVEKKDNQVWIVGAAHQAGLILRLKTAGWTVEHRVPL
jgi:hypothetical protein